MFFYLKKYTCFESSLFGQMKISRLFIKKLDLSQICNCHSHRLCKMTLDVIFQDLGIFYAVGSRTESLSCTSTQYTNPRSTWLGVRVIPKVAPQIRGQLLSLSMTRWIQRWDFKSLNPTKTWSLRLLRPK